MSKNQQYVIGVDYGTDSARAILLDVNTAEIIADSVREYPRWKKGLYTDAQKNQFRQHPKDYLECLDGILTEIVEKCPDRSAIRAIGVDTTASTPCACDAAGVPLALYPEYEENPDAMFFLWKDHSSQVETDKIVRACKEGPVDYTVYSGGSYSSEAYWGKFWHMMNATPDEFGGKMYSAIELCDWIPALLTGFTSLDDVRLSYCIAGIKQMYGEKWGGFPPAEFFSSLDPRFGKYVERLHKKLYLTQEPCGLISKEWATKLGLREDVVIGIGNVDAYSAPIGTGIGDGVAALSCGTSGTYMAVVPREVLENNLVPDVYDQVIDSILPGMWGIECGLSAFGDSYAWVKRIATWAVKNITLSDDPATDEAIKAKVDDEILPALNKAAAALPLRKDAPVATDYFNGRRTPRLDNAVRAGIASLTLGSTLPEVYAAVVEATAMASRAIFEHLEANGIKINTLIAGGGIALKSPFVMQTFANATGREIKISACKHAVALGAAVNGAVAAGIYPTLDEAMAHLCADTVKTYSPDPALKEHFDYRYNLYLELASKTESLR